MKPWRLLIVSEPGKDGVFVFVQRLIRYLHSSHPEVTVDFAYSSLRSGVELPTLVAEVEAHGGETADLRIGNFPQSADIAALKKIRDMVRRNGCSLVHAHSSKAGALVRLAALIPPFPPTVYSAHAYFGMARRGGVKEAIFNGIETTLGRVGVAHSCSDDERTFAMKTLKVPEKHLALILTGVNTDFYSPAKDGERLEFRRAFGIPEEGKLLVTIGRDTPQKNYAPLYTVLDRMLPSADWHVGHAGEGAVELRQSLSPEAASKCYAWTHLQDTSGLLRAADGFILTSLYEGLSLSMLHALACALPLIVPDAPGFRGLRRLGFDEVSWLPDPDAGDMTSAIEEAIGKWAKQPACQLDRQRELACKYFTEPVQLEELVQLYQTSMQSRGLP